MSANAEHVSKNELRVRLHPLLHQVSGSTFMFRFNNDTLCKPLCDKEYQFYKLIPESLKEFTAKYKGSIEMQVEESPDGLIYFYGVVPLSKVTSLNLDTSIAVTGSEEGRAGSPTLQSLHTSHIDYIQQDDLRLKRSGSIEINEDSLGCYDNPHTKLEAGKRLNQRIANLLDSKSPHRFILLENLVSSYERPSILDLKMGTRTHGDNDDKAKVGRKQRRCDKSTSKSLGVRLHGMQKYNLTNGKYETLTKYQGLELTSDQFRDQIAGFLCNGTELHRDLAKPIHDKLCRFYKCVSQQDTMRFYSSSLLIIYDGVHTPTRPSGVDVRAVDFAQAIYDHSPPPEDGARHKGPDKGYLIGLQTLIDIFSSICSAESHN